MTRVLLRTMMTAALLAAAAPQLPAEDCCPAKDSNARQMCGCHCDRCKTCRLAPGTRKLTKTCYSRKCEDLCIPNPSTHCGKTCEQERDPCTGCVQCVKKQHWTPSPCGRIITKHVLVKNEVAKEVPASKWEVVNICCNCRNRCAAENRAVPKDRIVNDPPQSLEQESTAVVQASAAVAGPSSEADQARSAGSPSAAVKQKLMSLLGK